MLLFKIKLKLQFSNTIIQLLKAKVNSSNIILTY